MALPDLTGEPPVRRITVARGTLTGRGLPDPERQALARAAAAITAKQAHALLPTAPVVQPTHVDVLFDADEGGVHCTVTVQAYARQDLDEAALMAVVAALVSLRPSGLAGRIEDVHVVQHVG